METIKVLLVDRDEIYLEGLAKILSSKPNFEVIATCFSALEGIKKSKDLKPDIILGDIEMSEDACAEAAGLMNELPPETRSIILTHSKEERALFWVLKVGARAYLSKGISAEELIRTIARIHAGEIIVSPPMAAKLLDKLSHLEESKEATRENHDSVLSPRETEVLELVARDLTNKEIATALFISENTVKVHLSNILEKLQVRSRWEAAAIAKEKGIVPTR